MPGRKCAVAICKNSFSKKRPDVSFHRFPKDPNVRKQWVVFCRRDGQWNPSFHHVCSDHFKPEDFVRDLQAELLGTSVKKRIKPNAIPSLHNKPDSRESLAAIRRRERMAKKVEAESRAKAIKDALENYDKERSEREKQEAETQNKQKNELMEQDIINKCLVNVGLRRATQEHRKATEDRLIKSAMTQLAHVVYEDIVKDLDIHDMYLTVVTESCRLRKLIAVKAAELKKDKETAASHIRFLEKNQITNDNFFPTISKALSNALTPNQIALLLKQRKQVQWTTEEIFRAFILRNLSCKAYLYLKNELNYPLPGLSSLRHWATQIDMRHGLLQDVLSLMDVAGRNLDKWQRFTVLQVDEMKVASQYEYDSKQDEIVGPHSRMQVVMARGLCAAWKVPVFVDFDIRITKSILLDVSTQLDRVGFKVVACVTNCQGSNTELCTDLGISVATPCFSWENGNIYLFIDAPYLLKQLRNCLLDTGFVLANGVSINTNPLKALLQMPNSDPSVSHGLSPTHLFCEAATRENLVLASQLLSRKTATVLLHYLPGENKQLAVHTGNFIRAISDWFDVMNTCKTQASNQPLKNAYGIALEDQDEALDKAHSLIATLHCTGGSSIKILQEQMSTSINALKMLSKDIHSGTVQHIMTRKLTLDSLEDLFAQMQSFAELLDHPSPLQAVDRMRMLILSKPLDSQQSDQGTGDSLEEEFLTASLLQKTNVSCTFKKPRSNLQGQKEPEMCQENVTIFNPEEFLSLSGEASETTNDTLLYLAGWIAKKLYKTHEHLGNSNFSGMDHSYCKDQGYVLPPWAKHLAKDGIAFPTPDFLDKVSIMEKSFVALHNQTGEQIIKGSKVVDKITTKLSQEINGLDTTVIQTFAKQRVIIRINYLNHKLATPL